MISKIIFYFESWLCGVKQLVAEFRQGGGVGGIKQNQGHAAVNSNLVMGNCKISTCLLACNYCRDFFNFSRKTTNNTTPWWLFVTLFGCSKSSKSHILTYVTVDKFMVSSVWDVFLANITIARAGPRIWPRHPKYRIWWTAVWKDCAAIC